MPAQSTRKAKEPRHPPDPSTGDRISELYQEALKTSVRTSAEMLKIPLTLCAGLCAAWADAIDSMADRGRP